MKTNPLTITQQNWSLRSALILVLCGAVVPHIARANDWLQQQQGYAYQQQQQMQEQQRQQQETARQQQAQRDIQQMYERQNQQQQQQQKMQEEEVYRQRARSAAEEQQRQADLRRKQSSDTPYYYYQNSVATSDVNSGETAGNSEPTLTTNIPTESYPTSDAQRPFVDVRRPANSYAAMLLWFIGGAFLTAIALRRKSFAIAGARQLPGFTRYQIKQWFLIAGHYCGTRIRATELQLKRSFRHSVSAVRNQLLQLIPPRWLVLRVASLAIGIAIILAGIAIIFASGIAFVKWQIAVGFVAMTIGYAIAAATWLVPWLLSRNPVQNSIDNMPTLSEETLDAHSALSDSSMQPLMTTVDQKPPTVAPTAANVSGRHSEMDTNPCSHASPIASTGQLCCDHCMKQFSVRGEGELAIRLVLCPYCGLALRGAADLQLSTFEKELPPILSAPCQNCHSLIDIPYLVIGTSISCPCCNAKMLAPDREDGVKHLRRIGHLLQG